MNLCRMPSNADRFPPEILSVFFVLVKQLVSSNGHRTGVARVNAEIKVLIKLSGVCRNWRQVVLGDGTLWTEVPIDTSKPDCGKLLRFSLERSKQSTVSVIASVFSSTTDREVMEDVLKIVAEGSSRIGDLILDIDSSPFLEGWISPAPALRKLRITNRGPCMALTTMFSGQIPRLESLTLSGFTACPAGFLGSLKHLALKLPLTHPAVLTTTLVDLLMAAQNIESLSLVSFLCMIDNSSPSLKATLPQLRNVLLRRCDTLSILPHIDIPKEAELHISVDHRALGLGIARRPADHHILLVLPPSLETYLSPPASPKLIVEVGESSSGFAIGLGSIGSTNLCLKMTECSGRIPVDFLRRSLEAIPSHIYFKTARNVTISTPPTVPGILWSSWLEKFRFATQLSVRTLPAEVILHALMRTDGDGLPVCPRLKRVGFYNTGTSAVRMDPKLIARLFLFRGATGFPLEMATVMECGVVKDFGPPPWLGDLVGPPIDRLRH